MNGVLQLINNHWKLVRDVACQAAEGRLFQRIAPLLAKAILVIPVVSTWQRIASLLSESRKL